MRYRTLGPSGLEVSLLGYGGWALGKKGWPGVAEKKAVHTLESCIDAGINFFDTAPIYGFGRSEELLGQVLESVRRRVFIATKCGLRWDDHGSVRHDLSRDSIIWEVEQSLLRLRTDYIDLYQIHWPDTHTRLEETLEALTGLKARGVIRHIGVCNFSAALLEKSLALAEIVSVQQLYNMIQREAEADILPLCRQRGLGFICYSPLAQGLLAGKFSESYRPGKHDVRRLNPLYRNRRSFQNAAAFVHKLPKPPAAQALAFLAAQDGITTILTSMTQHAHLLENSTALS